MVDLLAGHVQLQFASMPAVIQYVRGGKLRMLAQMGEKRSSAAPDTPTMGEAGVPGLIVSSGFGLMGPAHLPKPVTDRVHGALKTALGNPELRHQLSGQGADPVGNTPEEYAAFNKSEIAKWIKVAREANIPAGMSTRSSHHGARPMSASPQPIKPSAPRQDPHGMRMETRANAQAEIAKNFVSLQEIVAAAKRNLSQSVWDMLSGGSDSEMTLRRNRYAIDCLALRQRVLVDVTHLDLTTTLLGRPLPMPVFIAPIGNYLQLADPEGALPVARAAATRNMPMFVSTAAKPGIDEIAQCVPAPMIFQLYVRSDRAWVADILDKAKALGYYALCVTVDRAVYSRRERDLINRLPVREGGLNVHQSALTWDDVAWMKQHMQVPLILKGIASADDARLAVEHGADVVYVSNHGGRQLDQAQASIDVLPEVVAAVEGRAEVVMDGGICRGTDVVKAVALGARAVGVGKLYGWALAAAGEAGVTRMIDLLEAEICSTLGLMGVTALSQLNPSWLRPAPPVAALGVASPFPYFADALR